MEANMKYIKVMSADDTVVGVELAEEFVFIKYQDKNQIIIRCSEKEAQGVISAESDNTIYQLLDKEKIKGVDGDVLTAKFICKEDYENLQALFSDDNKKDDSSSTESEPDKDDNSDTSNVMTTAQMRATIISLSSDVKDLKKQNQMLTECLLDMSEQVYA